MQWILATAALILGSALGAAIVWAIAQRRIASAEQRAAILDQQTRNLAAELSEVRAALAHAGDVQEQLADQRELNGRLAAEVDAKASRLEELRHAEQQLGTAKSTIAELRTTLEQERLRAAEQLQVFADAREQMINQFKTLADEILDEKSQKFAEQNQSNLDQLLTPLKEKIVEFKTKVEEVYVQESKDRSALAEQVRTLKELNSTLSQEAHNLTLAIRGDKKMQGDWGEIILEDVLERAGLVRGLHYVVQESVRAEDGLSRRRLDVVVRLPGDRQIVIDSKLTLPDYRTFADAATDTERSAALKRHLEAVRKHMKDLSEKQYQSTYGLNALDCVVMFIPLEPAFMLAVTHDRELFHDGWEKNVLLVSPSTLLFVIRSIAALWTQENQKRNATDISRRGAELYDKLVGFVEDLKNIGWRLSQAQNCYDEARKKLCDGRGNVLRQAEMLKSLGVKPTKALPKQWLDEGDEEPAQSILNGSEEPLGQEELNAGADSDGQDR